MEKRKGTERREKKIDYKRRTLDRREKVFYYERQAYLTDTNFFQNVYFAQYFDFIGEAREDLFKFLLGEDFNSFMQTGIGISTVDTSIKYIKELHLFDRFKIFITITKIQTFKVSMSFKFVKNDSNEKIAEAEMTVCFHLNGKPIPVPDVIKERVKQYNLNT